MKRLVLFILIFGLVFPMCTGCTEETSDINRPEPTDVMAPEKSTVINIYRPPIGNFENYENIASWQEYIKKRYGIDFVLNYISPLHQSAIATGGYYPGAINEGKVSGIIELNVNDYRNMAVFIEEGLILPLEDYLRDNEAFLNLPAALQESFRLDDGSIWAIPGYLNMGVGTRYTKNEWLDNLSLEAPKTIDELFAVSKAFAYDDPDGNGTADEYGMCANRRTGARMFYDIFLANECFLSNYGACSIGYDYSTGAYEEAALKPGMLDTLNFIKSLNDEGILYLSDDWAFRDSYRYGHFYDISHFNGAYDLYEDWTKTYTLSDNKNSIYALRPRKCFVMTSNTEDPQGTINDFITTFFSDVESMAAASFGVPGIDYELSDNELKQIFTYTETEGQSNFIKENLWLVGLNFNLLDESGVSFESDYYSKGYVDYEVEQMKMIENMNNQNMLFLDSFFFPHQDYMTLQLTLGKSMYWNFLSEIDNINPGEYIRIYIENQKKAGAEQILQDINEKFGFSSTFSY